MTTVSWKQPTNDFLGIPRCTTIKEVVQVVQTGSITIPDPLVGHGSTDSMVHRKCNDTTDTTETTDTILPVVAHNGSDSNNLPNVLPIR
jgi:hypothetical protein